MNWFERYGITGIYYEILSFGLLIVIFPNLSSYINVQFIAIGAGISLPIGYLISILSQDIYYHLPEKWQIHRTVRKKLTKLPDYNEKRLESYLVIIHRLNPEKDQLENIKWVQDFVRKRWDVLAISSTLIIATFLAWILAISAMLFDRSISFQQVDCYRLFLIFILSSLVIIILWWSRCIMFDQIVEVYTKLFKKLDPALE